MCCRLRNCVDAFAHPEKVYPVRQDLYWLVKGNEAGLFAIDEGKGAVKVPHPLRQLQPQPGDAGTPGDTV